MQDALVPPGLTAAVTTVTAVEYGLVALAAVTLSALLVLRAKRDHDQKIRKAASVGYYDPDAARYWHGAVAPQPTGPPVDDAQPLAPSFVAPGRNKAAAPKDARPLSPSSVPSAFSAFAEDPSEPVPAFDPLAAVQARPATTTLAPPPPPASPSPPLVPPPPAAPSSPLPPAPPSVPSPPPPAEAHAARWTGAHPSLPRLEQPPPPVQPAPERTESLGR